MTRSKPNAGKINRFLETIGGSRARNQDDERLSPDSANFFSPRENLGRIKTTKTLVPTRGREAGEVGTSFDVLSPKQYMANFDASRKPHGKQTSVQLKRRYTAQRNRAGGRLLSMDPSSRDNGASQSDRKNGTGVATQRKTQHVFQRVHGKTIKAASMQPFSDSTATHAHQQTNSEGGETQAQTQTEKHAGIFQEKPTIQFDHTSPEPQGARGFSASNVYSYHDRCRLAEITRSFQRSSNSSETGTNDRHSMTFSWDMLRAANGG